MILLRLPARTHPGVCPCRVAVGPAGVRAPCVGGSARASGSWPTTRGWPGRRTCRPSRRCARSCCWTRPTRPRRRCSRSATWKSTGSTHHRKRSANGMADLDVIQSDFLPSDAFQPNTPVPGFPCRSSENSRQHIKLRQRKMLCYFWNSEATSNNNHCCARLQF